MRILCALHAHLGLVAALRRFPELRGEPVIVGGAPELRLPVVAASAAARAAGVRPGQPLRQAQQLCPAAAFVPLDTDGVLRLRERILTVLQRLTPDAEAGDDEVLCDISGTHGAYADEAAWAAAIARALHMELDAGAPAVGVGGSRFVARMAARRAEPGRIRRVRQGEEASFVAPLPLDVMQLEPAVAARLAAFGLDCLGAVASLSPADLQRQFGSQGIHIHRLARGDDREGLRAAPVAPHCAERIVLEGGVGDLEVLLAAARRCTAQLGAHLASQGLAAGEVCVVYELEGADPIAAAEVAPRPVGGVDDLWTVALGLLGRLQPQRPVVAVRVEAAGLAPAGGRQADLLRRGDAAGEAVAMTAARIRARFGEATVRRPRLALDPGDLPERRYEWAAPVAARV